MTTGEYGLARRMWHQLEPVHALVSFAAIGAAPEQVFASRGWSTAEWAAARDRLAARGWTDAAGEATERGRDGRDEIEWRTDRLADGPWQVLGAGRAQRLAGLTGPLLGAAFESGLLPPQSTLGIATVPAPAPPPLNGPATVRPQCRQPASPRAAAGRRPQGAHVSHQPPAAADTGTQAAAEIRPFNTLHSQQPDARARHRLDLAVLDGGNDPLQALPSPIHAQQHGRSITGSGSASLRCRSIVAVERDLPTSNTQVSGGAPGNGAGQIGSIIRAS